MRSERNLLCADPLEVKVRLDDVGREDVAAVEELLVGLEGVERLLEAAGRTGSGRRVQPACRPATERCMGTKPGRASMRVSQARRLGYGANDTLPSGASAMEV